MNGTRVAWGLYVLAALALVGVFVTYLVKSTVPDVEVTVLVLLVGACAGVTVPLHTTTAAAAPAVEAEAAPYLGGAG